MNQRQTPLRVILIGDSCVDEYHYGTVERISPEAPVPIFVPKNVQYKNGMAGNVANNLRNLGVEVQTYFGSESVKIRMIDEKSHQHLLRIDKDSNSDSLDKSTEFSDDVDAIVISDYNKGFVSYELVEQLAKTSNVPIFIDTKKTDLARFKNCIIKINELEYKNRISDPDEVIVTHGNSCVEYKNMKFPVPKVPTFDVCGAGDTFLAALVYEYLLSHDMSSAIRFAIKAASVTVQHVGVYAPKLEEII